MLIHLQQLWDDQSRIVHDMHDGKFVHDHYLTMIEDIEELEKLDVIMHKKLLMNLILQSLIHMDRLWNYYMNKYYSILTELINMLVTKGSWKVQRYIPKEPKEI